MPKNIQGRPIVGINLSWLEVRQLLMSAIEPASWESISLSLYLFLSYSIPPPLTLPSRTHTHEENHTGQANHIIFLREGLPRCLQVLYIYWPTGKRISARSEDPQFFFAYNTLGQKNPEKLHLYGKNSPISWIFLFHFCGYIKTYCRWLEGSKHISPWGIMSSCPFPLPRPSLYGHYSPPPCVPFSQLIENVLPYQWKLFYIPNGIFSFQLVESFLW